MLNSTWQHADNSGYHADAWPIKFCHSTDDLTAQLYLKSLRITQHEVPFIHLLEGRVTVSNNFPKRRQNSFKIGTRDKFAIHLRYENFISNEIVIYKSFFLRSVIFPGNSLYTQTVAYTMYFELRKPVSEATRKVERPTRERRPNRERLMYKCHEL